MPLVVLISGLPCTGKTTLGRRLAQELSLPFVHKDGIKELLFDHLGWQDRAWSKALGRVSSELLYYFAEVQLAAGRSLLLESNFDPTFATPKFRALQTQYGFTPVQIFCKAADAVLLQRFQQRAESGERHPGHVDHLNYAEFQAIMQQGVLAPLAIGGELIEVDTTDFQQVDYTKLITALRTTMNA
ncbi:MAG: ATP-binding protein [Caldilineaceae bacterium]